MREFEDYMNWKETYTKASAKAEFAKRLKEMNMTEEEIKSVNMDIEKKLNTVDLKKKKKKK